MVTLDIEDTCVRMMVVRGRRVDKASSLPLEPGLVEDGVVVDKAAVSQRIKELLEAHGVVEKEVAVGISSMHSIYRVIKLPQLRGAMLAEAARREMERVMPVPLDELYTSWQTVTASGAESVICAVSLPRNTVDAMLETLHQAGLEAHVMDVRSMALAQVADERDAIIIGAQPVGFDIVVMIDGIPELLRSLSFSSRDMPPSEKVAVIREELDRTVTFYNSSHKGNPITDNIAIFAGGDLKDMLGEVLDYPVKPFPELLSYPEDFDAGEYAVNIGLALKQVRASKSQMQVNINVIPEAYLPKPRPIIEVISWGFIVIAIAVLVPLGLSASRAASNTSALQAQVDSAQFQVQVKQGTKAELEGLQEKLVAAEAARDTIQVPLNYCEEQRAKVNRELSKVTSLLPGTIDMASIIYGESITIAGTAPDEATILSYARTLRDSGRFSQVTVSDMKEEEYNEWSFVLTLE